MSDQDDVINIQREIVAKFQAKAEVERRRNERDMRGRIARSGFYNPENDPDYVYVKYPRYVRDETDKTIDKNGKILGIAQNEEEERILRGIPEKVAKSVEINIADLGKNVPTEVRVKRAYNKKPKPTQLPQNIP